MDLILWRHAEALDPEGQEDDLLRPLTIRGEKHALRMAQWLDRQLPEGTRVLSSPAVRAEQTVRALQRKYKVRDALSPGASVQDVLEAAQWPDAKFPVWWWGISRLWVPWQLNCWVWKLPLAPFGKGLSGGFEVGIATGWLRPLFCL